MAGLTPSQTVAIRLFVETDANLAIGGPAGTGKSHTMERLRKVCDSRGLKHTTLAPRGACAFLGGGETIHRKLGTLPHGRPFWANATEMRTCLWRALGGRLGGGKSSRKALERADFFRGLDVLLVDEIYLAEAGLLAMLDLTARELRGVDAPMGGLRVVVVGDPYQLTPKGSTHVWRPVALGPPPADSEDSEDEDAEPKPTGHLLKALRTWDDLQFTHITLKVLTTFYFLLYND